MRTASFAMVAACLFGIRSGQASYGIYVGKNLTADGSVFLAGYGDEPSSHWLEIVPRREHPAGAEIVAGVDRRANYPGELIRIPQAPMTFGYITMNYSAFEGFPAPLTNGGINEHHVAGRDIWSPSRQELRRMTPDPQRGLNYSDLSRLAMERAHTAREAVEIVGRLINEYGYATYGGNSHLFADAEEGWVLINFAGGQGLWVAQRLGPNDIRVSRPGYIGDVPLNYQEHPDFKGSPNLIKFAVDQGWYQPESGDPFNVNKIYGDGKMRHAAVTEMEERLRAKAGKITLQDVMAAVRAPQVTGDSAGYGQVAHLHQGTHPELGVLWVASSSPVTAPFIPYRLGVSDVPPEFKRHRYLTEGEAARFMSAKLQGLESTRYAFQEFKRLFYLVKEHEEKFLPEVTEALERFEARLIEQQPVVVQTAGTLYSANQPELARQYLTYYSQTEALNGLRLGQSLADGLEARTKALYGIRQPATQTPVARTVDLNVGESGAVTLSDGSTAWVQLLDLEERRDPFRQAVRQAQVSLEVNGRTVTVTSATYHLPVTVGGVQIDCPITRGYVANSEQQNVWALEKDARVRLWPAGSPWLEPGTFGYPLGQRWYASDTQMANEPAFVDGGEIPGQTNVYYHYGLDFGGAEGLVEVMAATDGLVVSSAGTTLPDHVNSPAKPRYDVIYVVDARNWYYRYSHLHTIEVKAGQRVKMGQRLGLLGKEGGSGGWSHLHFDITRRQPSGQWGIEDAYAYVWEAYQRQHTPKIIAMARPHLLAAVGEKVALNGSGSWSAAGQVSRYEWTLSNGTTGSGPIVERSYAQPGTYSEILKVTGAGGEFDYDFAVVQVLESYQTTKLPPSIHAAYYPTTRIRPGDPVTFKVRTFRNRHAEETWDFGDGTTPEKVRSDGNERVHAKDGYAVTEHRYARPGHYLARVERANERGEKAVTHLHVHVEAR